MQSQQLIPYCGRDVLVAFDDTERVQALDKLRNVRSSLAARGNSGLWVSLQQNLDNVYNAYNSPTYQLSRYKLEILRESILPYISEKMLAPRFSLDKQRFAQLQQILQFLSPVETANVSSTSSSPHPALTLLSIDQIVVEIKRERSIWPSELAHTLELSCNKQWQPILHDHRILLHNLGGKAVILGLIELIGRPIVLLYPAYLLSGEILRLAQKVGLTDPLFNSQLASGGANWQRLNISDIMSIAKLIAMCVAVLQVMAVLGAYSGLGYTSMAFGFASLSIASSDSLLKKYIPAIAPHIVAASGLMDRVLEIEQSFMTRVQSGLGVHPIVSAAIFPSSPRVEVLSSSPIAMPVSRSIAPEVSVVPVEAEVEVEVEAEEYVFAEMDGQDHVLRHRHR